MRGRLWLNCFAAIIGPRYWESANRDLSTAEWTEFMKSVVSEMGSKMSCRVVQRRKDSEDPSGEHFNIDAIFMDEAEYEFSAQMERYGPFSLPVAAVELENAPDFPKISYCLWKVLCVRSSIRVLVCYQRSRDRVQALRQHLETVIWQGSLMKGTDSDLLIIVGNEKEWRSPSFETYFTVFEWRNDGLQEVRDLRWQ